MTEISEEQESTRPDLDRYLDIARRRHLYFLAPLFLGWLIVWGVSWVLPTKYKSSTLILVEQPTMPEHYVAPNVNENLQDRLQSITQQILSRTRLLLIIDKLKLYGGPDAKTSPDDKVELMRKDIKIELVRDTRNNEITSFRINYSAHDPVVAQQVTSDLTGLFINENGRVRLAQSEDTTKFIEKQLEDARAILADQEAKVRLFQGAHVGVLPTQEASNLQILGGFQGQLLNEQNSLSTAKQQRVYYQTLIEQYRNLHANSRTADGVPGGLPGIEQELDRLKAQLADLSSRYTDMYPDVVKVKKQIARTERLRQELMEAPKTGSSSAALDSANQSPAMLQVQSQLQANQTEIGNRERAIAGLQARIGEYQGRLNEEPATEQQLAELTRGYDQSKANYDELLKKKNQSVMATSMEQMQQGERFTILDPPSLPLKPDFPNRLEFCGIGLAAGLALGFVVVAGFEFFDDRMHGEKEIKELLPIAVISEIPEIEGPLDEERNRRRLAFGWTMAAVVIASILVGSTFSFLRG